MQYFLAPSLIALSSFFRAIDTADMRTWHPSADKQTQSELFQATSEYYLITPHSVQYPREAIKGRNGVHPSGS